MLVNALFSLAMAMGYAVASPFAAPTPTIELEKRAAGTPSIDPGISAQETQQLMDAFKDANKLADYAINNANMAVFDLYFDSSDFAEVTSVIKRLYNNNKPTAVLSQVSFSTDYPDPDNRLACSNPPYPVAQMREYESDEPVVIICPDRAFPHGGIDKGYPNVPAITCDYIGDTVSWKMDMLGGTVFHEYLHWVEQVTAGPTAEAIVDVAYGPYNCQQLDKSQALINADNYTWFAIQNLWTVLCDKTYPTAVKSGSDDPNCDNLPCKPTVHGET